MGANRFTRYAITIGLCALAGSALAVGTIKKRPLLHAKPAVAQVRSVPRLAFRAPSGKTAPRTVVAKPAAAQPAALAPLTDTEKPQLLALNGDWSVFRAVRSNGQTCYSASQPKDSLPRQPGRTPAYVYLANYAPGGIRHEVTIQLGLPAAAGPVTANIDGADFGLAISGTIAYPPDGPAQAKFLEALRHGHTLVLKTQAAGGAVVTDVYSLLGVDDSLKATDYACSLAAEPAPAP